MTIPKLALHGLDTVPHQRRVAESINNILSFEHDASRQQTPAERAAGVTPTNYAYPFGYVERYGAVGDGVTNDSAALQTAVDVVYAAGGGIVMCQPNKTYRIVSGHLNVMTIEPALQIKAGVRVEAEGATLACECGDGNQTGVWLYGDSAWINGATVTVASSGTPSSQGFFHATVVVGLPNNMGDDPDAPVVGQFMKNWGITNCNLTTGGLRRPAIGGIGGINGGLIENIILPDSSTCSGLQFDWGNTGTVSSGAIGATKTSFLAGGCYTTHPNNITIRNITIGTLSAAVSGDVGSFGIRVSGVYGFTVENLRAQSVTKALIFHTGGDLGFEFARDQDKRQALRSNVFRNCHLIDPPSTLEHAVFIDTLADNIYREQFLAAYSTIINPLMFGAVILEDCTANGANADATYGCRITQGRGVTVRRCKFSRWKHGIFVDEFTQDVLVEENDITANRNEGIQIGFGQLREGTERVLIRSNRAYGNGTDSAGADIRVTRGKSIWLEKNVVGVAGTTQTTGIRVDDASCLRDIRLIDNSCRGAVTTAYSVGGSSPVDALNYRVLTVCRGNTVDYGVAPTSGLFSSPTYLPVAMDVIGSQRIGRWYNPNTAAPTDGTWYLNDVLQQTTAAAAGNPGHLVTTSGTFGTLASITNGATTNGSKNITCSLSGLTCNTTQASYQVTVSSGTDIRAGMKCSIASAGIVNAEILSVSGTTLQLDTQANATQSGGAFTTCGLIEGEVISINTTTPIVGAVVMAISGTTVTLSVAASDTQSGRTISYTAPVFKTFPAVAA